MFRLYLTDERLHRERWEGYAPTAVVLADHLHDITAARQVINEGLAAARVKGALTFYKQSLTGD
jgi:hypothetical protein